jgi:hypothetical protein
MKYAALLLALMFVGIGTICFGQKHTYVRPYVKKNGTFVPGHYRTSPNGTNRDNFSTRPNINPYTGKYGYVTPDNKSSTTSYPTVRSANSTSSSRYVPTKNYYSNKSSDLSISTYNRDYQYQVIDIKAADLFVQLPDKVIEISSQDFTFTWYTATLKMKLYEGWRLPTIEELRAIYLQIHKRGKGNFNVNKFYWSIEEYDRDISWFFSFAGGEAYSHLFSRFNKGDEHLVRWVRDLPQFK